MSLMDKYEVDPAVRTEWYYRDILDWTNLRKMWHRDSSRTLVGISW
jgi:hypothetical protein